MKRFIILCCASIVLASCSKVSSSKVQNIIFFTPPVDVDADAKSVVLDKSKKPNPWHEGVNWVNNQPGNFAVTEPSSKFNSSSISRSGSLIAAPIEVDGKIFLLSNTGVVSAYDESRGRTLWSTSIDEKSGVAHYKGGLSYEKGRIYVTSASRELVVLDAESGAVIWRHKMADVAKSQPVIHQNMVFITTVSNDLFALDKESGAPLWQNDGMNETLSASRDISPVIYKDKVITSYSSGQLVAVDVKNGENLWELDLANMGENVIPNFIPVSLESQPVLDSSNLYVASGNGFLVKVNADDGSVEWKKKIYDIHSMNECGNTLFVTTNAMQVAALSKETGKVIWATSLFSEKELSKKKAKSPAFLLTPVVLNGNLFVASYDGKLYKLSPKDGKILSMIEIKKGASSLIVSDKLKIFTGGHVLVFGEEKKNGSANR